MKTPSLKLFVDGDATGETLGRSVDALMGEVTAVLAALGRPADLQQAGFGVRDGPNRGGPWAAYRDEFARRLRAGELLFAHADWRTPAQEWRALLEIDIYSGEHDRGVDLVMYVVTVSLDGMADAVRDAAADRLLAILRRPVVPGPVWGAVVHDFAFRGLTPYDRWTGNGQYEVAQEVRTEARGYYWANLLSAGHLAGWGGRDGARTAAAAAGLLTEDVGEGLIVRSPGPIGEFDDTKLATMKAFLRPVLPPKPSDYFDRYPLRILPD